MPYDYLVLDVFTDRPFGGNPLAVFPDAKGLDAAAMQIIAGELNLSETIFLTAGAEPDRWSARIFTPGMELPYAGHPTIGAALALAKLGRVSGDSLILDEAVGAVAVTLSGEAAILTSLRLPEEVEAPLDAAAAAALLGLASDELGPLAPSAWSAGVAFTFIPVANREALARASLDLTVWRARLAGSAAPHVYAFALADWDHGARVRARMFAPAMGISEDPATGAAATALAGLLARAQRRGEGSHAWRIHQGVEIGRPGLIRLEADVAGGAVTAVRVGGEAVLVARGRLEAGL